MSALEMSFHNYELYAFTFNWDKRKENSLCNNFATVYSRGFLRGAIFYLLFICVNFDSKYNRKCIDYYNIVHNLYDNRSAFFTAAVTLDILHVLDTVQLYTARY